MSSIDKYFSEHFTNKHFPRILDVGCGTKPYKKYFSFDEYIGIDVETSGRISENKHADLYYDGINIPTNDQSFDLVICTQVLEHVVDPEFLTKEFNRVLKPGGKLIITVPFMWGEHEVPYDFRRYSSFGLLALVEKNGFKIDTFKKIDCGFDALRTIFFSEINVQGLSDTFMWRFKLRVLRMCWKILGYTLGKTTLKRVYLDNFLIAQKN